MKGLGAELLEGLDPRQRKKCEIAQLEVNLFKAQHATVVCAASIYE